MTSEEFRNNPLFLRNGIKGKGNFDIPVSRKKPSTYKTYSWLAMIRFQTQIKPE